MALLDGMGHMFTGGGGGGSGYDEAEMALYRAQLQSQAAQENDARSQDYLRLQHRLAQEQKDRETAQNAYLSDDVAKRSDELFSPLLDEVSKDGYSPALKQIVGTMKGMAASGNPNLQKIALGSFDNLLGRMTPPASSPDTLLTNDVKNYRYAQAQGFGGSFADWLQQDARNKQGFENEYDKTLGKAQAEEFLGLQNAPIKRGQVLSQMEQVHGLLGDRGGFMGSTLQEMKMAADRLGVPIAGMDADQAAQAVSNDLALKLRSTGDGGGMPGAMSDADRQFLYKQVPSIDMTPQGRAKLIEVHRRMLNREGQVAELARAYASQHGRLDSGFYGALTQLRDQPLFDDFHQATGASAPQGITVRRIR